MRRSTASDAGSPNQATATAGRKRNPTTVAPAASRSILGARSGPAIRKIPSIHSRSMQPSGTITTGCTSGLGNRCTQMQAK
jgi:hypothetical protein